MENKLHILCTAPLEEALVKRAATKGVDIDVVPLIAIKPVMNRETKEEIMRLYLEPYNIVITSANAVKYMPSPDFQPDWKIFCVGDITKEKLIEKYGENVIAGTADNAALLAKLIINKGIEKVLFFCGDSRRDELPDKLKKANINVKEVVVYETIATPKKIARAYDGILFFSPSAVNSFFSENTTSTGIVLFAIGNTTADAIKQFSNNTIIIGEQPGKKELVEKMLTYYKQTTLKH